MPINQDFGFIPEKPKWSLLNLIFRLDYNFNQPLGYSYKWLLNLRHIIASDIYEPLTHVVKVDIECGLEY